MACHSGDPGQAAADLEPITSLGEPLANMIQAREYTAQQSLLDATQPRGNHYYWKSEFVPGLSDDLLRTYNAQFEGLTAPANQVVLFHLEGALSEHGEDDGAVGNRDAAFACVAQSMWVPDSPAGDANRSWVRSAWEALRPFSTGGNYVNFQTDDEPDERTRAVVQVQLRPARQRQGQVRPDQPVPGEPQHPLRLADPQRIGSRW